MATNFTTLRPPPPPQVHRISKEGEEKDAEFLLLRLLNKRSRVRVSPKPVPIDTGKRVLFAVANETNVFAAVAMSEAEQYVLIVSSLSALRSAFVSTSDGASHLTSQRSVTLPGAPSTVSFVYHGQRILIGLKDGQILMYDAGSLLSGAGPDSPIHTFLSPSGAAPRDILPNPGGISELAAVCYDTDGSTGTIAIQILDVLQQQSVGGWLNGGSPDTSPTAISWSPKGKQLAIGLLSGDIVTFSPTDTATIKTAVPRPSSLPSHCLISLSWLSNSDFHAVYVPSAPLTPDAPQVHLVLTIDSKANTSTEVQMSAPYIPIPGLCLPGSFPTVLRHWDPAKILMFLGDSCSSDIGLIGLDSQQVWSKFNLEETSTPTVPLDDDMNDTVLVGLALDLTAVETFQYKTISGEDAEAPPPPVLYAYASDGTIVGWHVVNTNNSPYPGMASPSQSALPVSSTSSMDTMKSGTVTALSPAPVFTQPSAFGQTSVPTSAFGQSAFGQLPAPAFGQSSFGQTSFGAATTSAFGQSSFGNTNAAPKSGFGAFATGGPVAWGQGTAASTFSSNALAPSTSVQSIASPMAVSNSASGEEAMAADGMAETNLGGLSLGGPGDGMDVTRPSTGRGVGSVFGSFPPVEPPKPAEGVKPVSALSSIKPATGFGAFGAGTSAFGSGSTFSDESSVEITKPSSGFGTSSGNVAAPSAFGQNSFPQSSFGKSSFGQASFGVSSFGTAATPAPATTSAFGSTGGGFSAFAQGGTAGFGVPKKGPETNGKPAWITDDHEPQSEEKKPVFGGGFSAFAQGGTTAFGLPKADSAAVRASTSPSVEAKMSESAPSQFIPLANSSSFGVSQSRSQSESSEVKVEDLPGKIPSVSAGIEAAVFGATSSPKPPTSLDGPQGRSTTPPTRSSEVGASIPTSLVRAPTTPKEEHSTTPTPSALAGSPFKSTSVGPTSGAFAGLTANLHGFSKLDSGFGAFGGGVSTSSPFFNPPKSANVSAFGVVSTTPTSTPKSVFGAQSTPVSSFGKPGPSTPTSVFGAPSPLGASAFGKPAWGTTPTTTPPMPPSSTSSNAFSAFSGMSSALSAFPSEGGSNKSFGDLLRSAEDSPEPVKVSKASVPAATEDTATKDARDLSELTYDDESDEHADGDEDETGSFLSQSFSEESVPEEGGEEEEEEQELEETEEDAPESPNQTPIPELFPQGAEETESVDRSTPSIQLTSPSPPVSPGKTSKDTAVAADDSTTPPGSPVKHVSPVTPETSPVTAPVPVTPANVPFGVGLGRPSTRPTRSSPLASAPILGDDGALIETIPTSKSAPLFSDTSLKPKTPPSRDPIVQEPLPAPSSVDEGSSVASKSTPPPIVPDVATSSIPKLPVFSIPPSSQSLTPTAGTSKDSLPPKPALTVPGVFGQTKGASTALTFVPPAGAVPAAKASIFSGGFTGFGPKTSSPSPPPAISSLVFTPPDKTRPSTPSTNMFSLSNTFKVPAVPTSNSTFGSALSLPTPPKLSATPGSTPPSLPSGSLKLGQKVGTSFMPTQVPSSPSQGVTPPQTQETLGDLQRACLSVYNLAEQELKNVKTLADEVVKRTTEYGKPTKVSKTKADLGDASKWAIGDVHEFARIMKLMVQDVSELQTLKAEYTKSIRELESTMLRATTKKEEIIRFNKASTDAEFAKVLKSRTLGPEHLETQTQLRRQIRVIRDRIQTLEDHLQAAKKRLNEFKTNKPAVRAPSLDTINRTYRNIDLAVSQQAHDIAQLSTRISKLKIDESRRKSASPAAKRGERCMPEDSIFTPDGRNKSTPPRDVTPNVAATTAAALNAERAAQKLKKALLKVRKEPLLNTQAAEAVSVPIDFQTPSKPDAPTPVTGSSASLLNLDNISFPTILQTPPTQIPAWNLSSFSLNEDEPPSPSPDLAYTRHRTHSGSKYHQRAVPLKKSPAAPTTTTATSSPPASFNWGPLPGVKPKSTISIFDDIKK